VQAIDRYVGTLRARIVLVDDGVRAPMTASWLKQMGLHDVVLLEDGLADGGQLETGTGTELALGWNELQCRKIAPAALQESLQNRRIQVLDLTRSVAFRTGHIGGAQHGVRTLLAAPIGRLPAHDLLVLTSEDGRLACYAAAEAATLTSAEVVVLDGGNAAWQAAGFPLVAGEDGLEETPVDAFLRAYDCTTNVEQAMQAYLDWEVDLIHRLETDGTLPFRSGDIPGAPARAVS